MEMLRWRHWPLAAKLTMAIALLVIITTGLLTVQATRRGHQEMEDRARLLLDDLAAGALDALYPLDVDTLSAIVQRCEAIPTVVSVHFYDGTGHVIDGSAAPAGPGTPADPFGQRLTQSGALVFEWSSGQLLAGRAVVVDGRRVGAVSLALSTAQLGIGATMAFLQGLAVAGLAIVVGALLSVLLSRSITLPLQETVSAARRISQGDFSAGIPVYNGTELEVLGSALNEMTAELQQAVGHKGAILEAMFEGVIIVDRDGQIVEINPAARRMFGYSGSELPDRRISALFDRGSLRSKPKRDITSYLREGQGSLFGRLIEATAIRADGTEFPIEWAITLTSSTEPALYTLVVHDISERKRAEDELRRAKEAAETASRAKSTFLANMTHEVRTPLTSIIGYSELLQQECFDRGYIDLIPDLGRIATAGQHLLDLINNILDLSRIEAGKLDIRLETFDLADLIEDVVTVGRPLAVKNGNNLEVDYPNDIGSMHADRTKVRQVLLNLLSNAAKFTKQGSIHLTAAPELRDGARWICFSVADTGIGMTEQQVRILFQAFTQADSSIAYEYGGSGLGLAISQRFCRLMGGEILVKSALQEGSVFTVYLPAVVSEGAISGGSPTPQM